MWRDGGAIWSAANGTGAQDRSRSSRSDRRDAYSEMRAPRHHRTAAAARHSLRSWLPPLVQERRWTSSGDRWRGALAASATAPRPADTRPTSLGTDFLTDSLEILSMRNLEKAGASRIDVAPLRSALRHRHRVPDGAAGFSMGRLPPIRPLASGARRL